MNSTSFVSMILKDFFLEFLIQSLEKCWQKNKSWLFIERVYSWRWLAFRMKQNIQMRWDRKKRSWDLHAYKTSSLSSLIAQKCEWCMIITLYTHRGISCQSFVLHKSRENNFLINVFFNALATLDSVKLWSRFCAPPACHVIPKILYSNSQNIFASMICLYLRSVYSFQFKFMTRYFFLLSYIASVMK